MNIKKLNEYCQLNDKAIIVHRGKLCGLFRGYRVK